MAMLEIANLPASRSVTKGDPPGRTAVGGTDYRPTRHNAAGGLDCELMSRSLLRPNRKLEARAELDRLALMRPSGADSALSHRLM